jgi:hypothetical protein
VPSDFSTPSATSQIRINGALSLQPYGLRPAPSLSTLNPRRYRREPKTRYGMCWVGTFPVALAATSSGALRGAPKTYGSAVHTIFQILAGSQIGQGIWTYGEAPRHEVMVMLDNFPEKGGSMGELRVHKSLKRQYLSSASFPKRLLFRHVALHTRCQPLLAASGGMPCEEVSKRCALVPALTPRCRRAPRRRR